MADIAVSAVQSLAVSAAAVAIGVWIKNRSPALDRTAIPASILGGLLFAAAILLLRERGVTFAFDTSLRDLLMLVCFTIIGLNASFDLLKRGGMLTPCLLVLASAGSIFQNVTGIAIAKLLGLNPLIGALAGSVSLAGGPATSIAFGGEFEKLGITGATTIGLASATFGIAVSGLIAGPLADRIIRRRNLRPGTPDTNTANAAPSQRVKPAQRVKVASLLNHGLWIAGCLGIGSVITAMFSKSGVTVPGYIGAMIVAAVLRNLDDRFGFAHIDPTLLNDIFQAVLPLFIGMAMATLKLWDLAALAVPLLALLTAQIVLTTVFCALCFRLLGRDYDAAAITAGFAGFMIGITPNAIASIDEVERQHGPSPKALLIVPIVGGFLNDFTNSLIITATISLAPLLH